MLSGKLGFVTEYIREVDCGIRGKDWPAFRRLPFNITNFAEDMVKYAKVQQDYKGLFESMGDIQTLASQFIRTHDCFTGGECAADELLLGVTVLPYSLKDTGHSSVESSADIRWEPHYLSFEGTDWKAIEGDMFVLIPKYNSAPMGDVGMAVEFTTPSKWLYWNTELQQFSGTVPFFSGPVERQMHDDTVIMCDDPEVYSYSVLITVEGKATSKFGPKLRFEQIVRARITIDVLRRDSPEMISRVARETDLELNGSGTQTSSSYHLPDPDSESEYSRSVGGGTPGSQSPSGRHAAMPQKTPDESSNGWSENDALHESTDLEDGLKSFIPTPPSSEEGMAVMVRFPRYAAELGEERGSSVPPLERKILSQATLGSRTRGTESSPPALNTGAKNDDRLILDLPPAGALFPSLTADKLGEPPVLTPNTVAERKIVEKGQCEILLDILKGRQTPTIPPCNEDDIRETISLYCGDYMPAIPQLQENTILGALPPAKDEVNGLGTIISTTPILTNLADRMMEQAEWVIDVPSPIATTSKPDLDMDNLRLLVQRISE
ncbi:uncharacterized protein GIQ15_06502 [Arthroderma uncinatum]|uniref:uncharacterized protein n=1 Tax=Arthroderma uncinatum TaxID=74035 RepID=UPI00144AB0BC|nr:uncharacterized protein GIQ15_06502 [Arthroderma uncinatum]KAF3479526.1 hypothetical protein GIQ15_06502 [Arthroderma uncinatum]